MVRLNRVAMWIRSYSDWSGVVNDVFIWICGGMGRATAFRAISSDLGLIPTCGALEVWPWNFGSRTAWLLNKPARQPQFTSMYQYTPAYAKYSSKMKCTRIYRYIAENSGIVHSICTNGLNSSRLEDSRCIDGIVSGCIVRSAFRHGMLSSQVSYRARTSCHVTH
jgi:hypothetical protein